MNKHNQQQAAEAQDIEELLNRYQVKQVQINNRRYLGNKFSLTEFIREIANTVGHYNAYRKNGEIDKPLILNAIIPIKKSKYK